mmetsp:Transcript_38/g.61  ORF Transcript_38/g.61 Transcript_38/m.61 type:complete len:80 (-) Transcript_38:2225-2464(-)
MRPDFINGLVLNSERWRPTGSVSKKPQPTIEIQVCTLSKQLAFGIRRINLGLLSRKFAHINSQRCSCSSPSSSPKSVAR